MTEIYIFPLHNTTEIMYWTLNIFGTLTTTIGGFWVSLNYPIVNLRKLYAPKRLYVAWFIDVFFDKIQTIAFIAAVITTAQLHSTKPKLRFCSHWNPTYYVSEVCNVENPWKWYRLEIRLNALLWSTIPEHNSLPSSSTSKALEDCYIMNTIMVWF